ncbi:MAG TPA: hypothetical protein VN754_04205 [Candidatus Binataceae bacterium]|nr:hypothetical protein [Candidatus Binataceae bacterium]
MTIETQETTKKKGSRPTHEISPANAEGKYRRMKCRVFTFAAQRGYKLAVEPLR